MYVLPWEFCTNVTSYRLSYAVPGTNQARFSLRRSSLRMLIFSNGRRNSRSYRNLCLHMRSRTVEIPTLDISSVHRRESGARSDVPYNHPIAYANCCGYMAHDGQDMFMLREKHYRPSDYEATFFTIIPLPMLIVGVYLTMVSICLCWGKSVLNMSRPWWNSMIQFAKQRSLQSSLCLC
jgi:hypothetical protein